MMRGMAVGSPWAAEVVVLSIGIVLPLSVALGVAVVVGAYCREDGML